MSSVPNDDRAAYGKWVNVVASMLLPGSAHFLSGRKEAGVTWFVSYFIVWCACLILFVSPMIPSLVPLGIGWLLRIALWVAIIADGCRKAIPRRRYGWWAAVCVLLATWWIFPSVLVRKYLGRPFSMASAAMAPTLRGEQKNSDGRIFRGDQITINEWTYHFHPPQRGDVVVFRTDAIGATERAQFQIPGDEMYVKRLVGLPGERVSILPPSIYINGEKLVQPRAFENFYAQSNASADFPNFPAGNQTDIELGTNEYYVVGDNITNSLDSRYFGPIQGGHFVGKAVWIFWPPKRQGFVQ